MVFKRRERRSTVEQIRDAVYPRKGWRRAIHYIAHRIKRLPDTPHKIALGFACGVFVSFSPLFGLHFIYAGLCAFVVRGNILAGLLGTFFGNPLTFPLIATLSYGTGLWLMGVTNHHVAHAALNESVSSGLLGLWHSLLSLVWLSEPRWDDVLHFFEQVFIPYFIGGLLPGLAAAAATYFLARPVVYAYQKRRRAKLRDTVRNRSRVMKTKPAE